MDKQHPSITKVKQNNGKKRSSKQCMVEKWNLMNPRDSEQNLCSPKFIKTAFAGKGVYLMTHYNGAQVCSDATSDEDSGGKSCRRQGMEKARDNSNINCWEKSRVKRSLFWKHNETKKIMSTLHH